MPKKSFKKLQSFKKRALRRTQKAAKMAAYARSQIQRQANRSSARELKEFNRIFEAANQNNGNNNGNNNGTPETTLVAPLANEQINENNEVFVGSEWNVNQPSFGRVKRRAPGRTVRKEKKNRLLTRKEKQRQRNLSLQRARLGKHEERENELGPAVVQNAPNTNANLNEDVNVSNNFAGPGMFYNYNNENYNELERQEQERELQKMREEMAKAETNRFYIRVNREKPLYTTYELYEMIRRPGYVIPRFIQLLYLSKNPQESYYYEYVEHIEEDDEYSYNSWGPYRRTIYRGWKVYKKDPMEYFRRRIEPHYYDFYGPNENEFNNMNMNFTNENILVLTSRDGLLRHLKRLPHFQEESDKEVLRLLKKERAKATAPAKLKELQLQGIEGWIQQMEAKTGMTMPRDAQNIIERGIKPINYRYYQGRDNLQRIKTNLFDNQADVPRHLKKISTNLFEK
jgi:hypothetical protein